MTTFRRGLGVEKQPNRLKGVHRVVAVESLSRVISILRSVFFVGVKNGKPWHTFVVAGAALVARDRLPSVSPGNPNRYPDRYPDRYPERWAGANVEQEAREETIFIALRKTLKRERSRIEEIRLQRDF